MMIWEQKMINLKPRKRGCYLIQDEINAGVGDILAHVKIGLANLLLQHTSAALSLNQNCDSDVRKDMNNFFNRLVPQSNTLYEHSAQGLDDMPAHIKSILAGTQITIPITNGRFNLGTWQGIWLLQFRNDLHQRKVIITIQGKS